VDVLLKVVTVLEVEEEIRKNGVETEKNRDKSSKFDSYVTFVVVR